MPDPNNYVQVHASLFVRTKGPRTYLSGPKIIQAEKNEVFDYTAIVIEDAVMQWISPLIIHVVQK